MRDGDHRLFAVPSKSYLRCNLRAGMANSNVYRARQVTVDKKAGQVCKRRDSWGQWQSGEPIFLTKSGQQLCSHMEMARPGLFNVIFLEKQTTDIYVKYDFQM